MAITQYTEPATVNPSLTDWQNSIARDNASSRGFAEVDLSSYADGATAPTVAVGSRFDNDGALYVVSGTAESISGIAGIANSTTFYVYFDVSAGVFLASTTAPTFDKEKRGWYNGNDRALFRIYKDSGGNYVGRSGNLEARPLPYSTLYAENIISVTSNTIAANSSEYREEILVNEPCSIVVSPISSGGVSHFCGFVQRLIAGSYPTVNTTPFLVECGNPNTQPFYEGKLFLENTQVRFTLNPGVYTFGIRSGDPSNPQNATYNMYVVGTTSQNSPVTVIG